jgi:hypothetical protein
MWPVRAGSNPHDSRGMNIAGISRLTQLGSLSTAQVAHTMLPSNSAPGTPRPPKVLQRK